MPRVTQLRVIDQEKRLATYDLDPEKGIITIGPASTDDICLENPDQAFFHLELDYRQQPFRLSIPSHALPVSINQEGIPSGDSYEISDQDVIRVAGYTITFGTYDKPSAPVVARPPAPPSKPDLPPPALRPDEETEVTGDEDAGPSIVASLPQEELAWTTEVEQTVTLHLTVVNGGELVAHFNVAVEGVPPEWVDVDPADVHLNERASTVVTITVTPPRSPASRAGTHPLALIVTSPDNYPGQRCKIGVELTIKPYYELAIANVSPQSLSIPGSQPSGQVEVPLENKGNSEVLVGLAGEDDARACHFEFQIPGDMDEPLSLTRQVNLCLPYAKALRVPVRLIPQSRPLIGSGGRLFDLRPRVHPYTITVTTPQGQQGPWTLMGMWENKPRFSRTVLAASLLALVLLWLAATYLVFKPRILTEHYIQPASIRAGQLVELNWRAWPPFLIGFKLDGQAVSPPVVDRPGHTTTYELRADTWLSHLLPFLADTQPNKVVVRPVAPDILLFEARPDRAIPGQTVVLSWVVDDASELVLVDNGAGVQETLTTPCGSREMQVGEDTVHYTLRVTAADGAVVERTVAVQVGSPVISVFSVAPTAVSAFGTDVTLNWEVLGVPAPTISLSRRPLTSAEAEPGETSIPPQATPIATTGTLTGARGSVVQPVDSTTLFTLRASNGTAQVVETLRVKVLKPTPMPAPDTPLPTAEGAFTPTPTPFPTPASPDTIIVYTAMSEEELGAVGLGADRLTLGELKGFDSISTTPNDPTNVLVVRRSTEELIALLLAEKENPRADVVWVLAATGMIRLRAEGMLEPLAGLNEPPGIKNIKPGWNDPTGPPHWIGLGAWLTTFCVNEALLKDETGQQLPVPQSWSDLENSIYHGHIVMPSPATSGSGYMMVSGLIQMQPFGEPDGWEHLDRLHENVDWYTRSGSDPCQLVDNNEIAIGLGANLWLSDTLDYKLVNPPDGAGWEMDAVALVRKDQINEHARDFVAWAISQEAMEQYVLFRPVLSYAGLEPAQGVKGFDAISADRYLWAAANMDRIIEKWQSRYGSQ